MSLSLENVAVAFQATDFPINIFFVLDILGSKGDNLREVPVASQAFLIRLFPAFGVPILFLEMAKVAVGFVYRDMLSSFQW